MLEHLENQTSLTRNQRKIVFAAILGDMLDFFDFYLIGFVLAFIVGAVEAHLRPVGDDPAGRRIGRRAGRAVLGLARRSHRPAQGVHRHGAEFFARHRAHGIHAGTGGLDLS